MREKYKVVYYVNQFFGQIGEEDMASAPVEIRDEKVGPAAGFEPLLDGQGEVVRTIICGDNYFNENKEKALAQIIAAIKECSPQILVAGPAFNAGRYGVACGEIAKAAVHELGIPVVTGMYIENPGLDICKETAYVVSTGDSAAGMRKALPLMAELTKKLVNGDEVGSPEEMGYIPRGIRKTVFVEKRGSERAIDMLLARLAGKSFETEMPMPVFDTVPPAPAVKDLAKATIAICTTGGIVPKGNPDCLESASAQKWVRYDISRKKSLTGYEVHDSATKTYINDFYSTHGGYDTSFVNEVVDRVLPLDVLNEFKDEGYIGGVHKFFYSTTGTGTAVSKAKEFGTAIGAELTEAKVDGVILTST